jgi:hypothetical protein
MAVCRTLTHIGAALHEQSDLAVRRSGETLVVAQALLLQGDALLLTGRAGDAVGLFRGRAGIGASLFTRRDPTAHLTRVIEAGPS